MSDATPKAPHFLRVIRAIARVKGAAFPLAAVTTVVAGVHCGDGVAVMGVTAMGGSGTGGGTTTTTTQSTSTTSSLTSASSGGFAVMDGGGSDAATDAGGDGG